MDNSREKDGTWRESDALAADRWKARATVWKVAARRARDGFRLHQRQAVKYHDRAVELQTRLDGAEHWERSARVEWRNCEQGRMAAEADAAALRVKLAEAEAERNDLSSEVAEIEIRALRLEQLQIDARTAADDWKANWGRADVKWREAEARLDAVTICETDGRPCHTTHHGGCLCHERQHAERLATVTAAVTQQSHEIEQVLGKALGYPWYKDDLATFPAATEADGVCVGEHTPESLADEAAERLLAAEARAEHWQAEYAILKAANQLDLEHALAESARAEWMVERVERMRVALEWYANRDAYPLDRAILEDALREGRMGSDIIDDLGQRARAALATASTGGTT